MNRRVSHPEVGWEGGAKARAQVLWRRGAGQPVAYKINNVVRKSLVLKFITCKQMLPRPAVLLP